LVAMEILNYSRTSGHTTSTRVATKEGRACGRKKDKRTPAHEDTLIPARTDPRQGRTSYAHAHAHASAQMQTRTRTHTRTQTPAQTQRHVHRCTHAHAHTRACNHAATHKYTRTQTPTPTQKHTETHTYTHSGTHRNTQQHTHTHTHAHAHTHTRTYGSVVWVRLYQWISWNSQPGRRADLQDHRHRAPGHGE
jgi:hypothetical protein